jgi:hypothetical protein
MSDLVPAFVIEFNKIVEECATFRYITRDSRVQKEARARLRDLRAQIEAEKESARASADGDYANLLLGCECAADALSYEISMWLLLKEGQPDQAWDALVDAQINLSSAMRAHVGFARVDDNIRRLDAIERLIFPPQIFLSTGMIVKSQICSICGGEYEDCEHVKGRPYMGEFCTVRLIPSAVDHVAMVDSPANKRCRILKFSADGGYRNRMTWAIEPRADAGAEPAESLMVEGLLAVSSPPRDDADRDIAFVD